MKDAVGHIVYSITFFMFGIMMSDAAFADTILPLNENTDSWSYWICMMVDLTLTSSVGLSFFWNGLVDVGILNEDNSSTLAAMLLSYIGIFLGWVYVSYYQLWLTGFPYLYIDLIAVSCGTYLLTETIHVIRTKDTAGLGWVALAGLSGLVGLASIAVPSLDVWCCHTFGCFYSGNFWWFLLTDVAMYSMWRYYAARIEIRRKMKIQLKSNTRQFFSDKSHAYELLPKEDFHLRYT